jgi:hypothetical protein
MQNDKGICIIAINMQNKSMQCNMFLFFTVLPSTNFGPWRRLVQLKKNTQYLLAELASVHLLFLIGVGPSKIKCAKI